MEYVVRPVRSPAELAAAFDLLGAQLPVRLSHRDRHFADLARRFAEDRSLMLVAESGGTIVGGALAFRGEGNVTLRILALVPEHRHRGLGTRLVREVEREAARLGAREIALGADEAVPFYHRLGYRGTSGLSKQLALSFAQRDPDDRRAALEALRARRQARLGHS